jgi:hypothetical protein
VAAPGCGPLGDARKRVPIQRQFQQGEVAHSVDEARTGDLGAACSVDPAVSLRQVEMITSRKIERWLLADLTEDLEVLLSAARHIVGRRIRHAVEQLLSPTLQLGESRLGLLKLLLRPLQLLQLIGRRLPRRLQPSSQFLRHSRCRSPRAIDFEQFLNKTFCAFARQLRQVCAGILA